MQLSKYVHSCLRIGHDGGVLVIDPGMFAEPAVLDGVDAVLVTHEHPDHLDVDLIRKQLDRRPLAIYGPAALADRLEEAVEVFTPVEPGQSFEAAGISVRAYGGQHAVIHPDIPRIANLAYLVNDEVYHPGDSLVVPQDSPVDTLFVPIHAPWLKVSEAIDFVRAVAPRRAVALHDGLLNEAGLKVTGASIARLVDCDYLRLNPGSRLD